MKRIIRVFPRRTNYTPDDNMTFIGFPGLFRPDPKDIDEVHISCLFTWDIPLAKYIAYAWGKYYDNVKIGGPAFKDTGNGFIPGMYVKKGVTFTSRGCPRKCSWCYVPYREGNIRILKIHPGNIVQDNNLLACPDDHIKAVFDMLEFQKGVVFSGGLDARLLKEWHVKEFDKLSIKELWFAADYPDWYHLEKCAKMLLHYSRSKKRCYVLIGFRDDTIKKAEARLERVWDIGFLPFAQIYRGNTEIIREREWNTLQYMWTRPAVMKARHKDK